MVRPQIGSQRREITTNKINKCTHLWPGTLTDNVFALGRLGVVALSFGVWDEFEPEFGACRPQCLGVADLGFDGGEMTHSG